MMLGCEGPGTDNKYLICSKMQLRSGGLPLTPQLSAVHGMMANYFMPVQFPPVCKSCLLRKSTEGFLSPPEAAAPVKTVLIISFSLPGDTIRQWSPIFLAKVTNFVEDNFSRDGGSRRGKLGGQSPSGNASEASLAHSPLTSSVQPGS